MPQKHFVTAERFIVSYDDVFYKFNQYGGNTKTELDSPTWELVRLSNLSVVIQGFAGVGTEVRDTTGITTGTFLGLPRLILPNT
jgi:hypothetical protein